MELRGTAGTAGTARAAAGGPSAAAIAFSACPGAPEITAECYK